jgi:TRAP-type C4-dicarboxylate transport system substrate-binding protein
MPLSRRALLTLALAWSSMLAAPQVHAQDPVRVKVGTLAPKGSIYHRVLQEMGESFRAASGNGSAFTIYTDGSQGSEADVVRRMRIGQLNAAMMTVVGLTEIDASAGVLQKMPLLFRSWDEVEYLNQALRPEIERRFLEKGFVVILWAEAGWVRFFCKEPAALPSDLKARRMFAWAGDSEQVSMMKALGYRPVVLETADIIPGLQTGLIDTVPVTPSWALATQVDRLAPHMIDVRWAPIVGALVFTRKAWDAMTPAARDALRASAPRAAQALHEHQLRADAEAIAAMQKRGLQVLRPNPEQEAAWHELAQRTYPLIRGQSIPPATFDEALRLIASYRARRDRKDP